MPSRKEAITGLFFVLAHGSLACLAEEDPGIAIGCILKRVAIP